MFRNLFLLASVVSIVLTACNKESITDAFDESVAIENSNNELAVRGDGLKQLTNDLGFQRADITYATYQEVPTEEPLYITSDCRNNSNLQTFTLVGNSAYQYINQVSNISAVWQTENFTGQNSTFNLNMEYGYQYNITCEVSYTLNSQSQTTLFNFSAEFTSNGLVINCLYSEDVACGGPTGGGGQDKSLFGPDGLPTQDKSPPQLNGEETIEREFLIEGVTPTTELETLAGEELPTEGDGLPFLSTDEDEEEFLPGVAIIVVIFP